MAAVVERVQVIAAKVDTLPAEFIRPDQERPGLTTWTGPVPAIPIVDMSDPAGAAAGIVDAAREWGLFQVVNHGIPPAAIAELQRVGKAFFGLPPEEKEKHASEDEATGKVNIGYGTKLQKDLAGKKNWVDFYFHNVYPPAAVDYSVWPQNPPEYRAANEEYTKHLLKVVDEILRCLSESLGLAGGALKAAAGGDDMIFLMKINHYPPCPCPELTLGVPPHTDMSVITVLVPNEIPGLQVCKDGRWFDAEYVPNALIVHVGDQVEIMSNGKYKSVLHRTTVNKDKVRMSWPVFVEPPPEKVIGPLPELVDGDNPAKFKSKAFKDYKHCKLNKLPQ